MAEKGQRIGEYVLDAKIGQGSFGEVWRAHHGAWHDQVAAVKIPTDPSFVRNLQRQGISLYKLTHPNITRAIGFDPTAAIPYLMTEFVPGCSLRQFLAMGKPSLAQSVTIMKQLLAGLEYAHERGMVHGDVKPENILIATGDGVTAATLIGDGAVKITDFGLGIAALATATGSSARMSGSEAGGVSTQAYIAPEQRDGSPPDVKSDIFACGVVLFELLTGERPAGTELPSELNSAIPVTLDDVFRRSYARRDRRYASATEFLAAIDKVIIPPSASEPKIAPPVEPSEQVLGFKRDENILPLAPPPKISPPPAEPDEPRLAFKDEAAPAPQPVRPPIPPPTIPLPPVTPPMVPAPAMASASVPPVASRPAGRPPSGPIIDQLTRQPVRNGDDVRTVFSRYFKARELDVAEAANIVLRLDKWAEGAGGIIGFAQRVVLEPTISTPYYKMTVTTRYIPDGRAAVQESDKNSVESIDLANADAALDCSGSLQSADYRPVIVLATNGTFPESMVDAVPAGPLKSASARLLSAARVRAGARTVAAQELRVTRATCLSVRYKYQNKEYAACLIGESLRLIAPASPVLRIREDLVKHATILLESENVLKGLDELRLIFEMPKASSTTATTTLSAVRAKLAAAYAAAADAMLGSLSVLESLKFSDKSLLLHPGNDAANAHVRAVRRWTAAMQLFPATVIGIIFGLLAARRPINYAFLVAAAGSLVSGLVMWHRLGTRMERTLTMFVHACLLPVALAAVLATAPAKFDQAPRDIVSGVLLAVVIAADIMLFRRLGNRLFAKRRTDALVGSPGNVLGQIRRTIERDWDHLQAHYAELGSLSKYSNAQITAESDDLDDLPSEPADASQAGSQDGPAEDADLNLEFEEEEPK